MIKRTKEPFYGYWGFPGGKLDFEDHILECATKEIKEETGITCDIELKGLFSSKTYNKEQLSYHYQLFVTKGTNPKGETLKKTREGKVALNTIKDIPTMNILT